MPDAPTSLKFFVAGEPIPQGSMKAFVVAGTARVVHSSPEPLAFWRQRIATEAQAAMGGGSPLEGAVSVQATFYLPRPKSRPKRHFWPDRRPDIDKLARSLLDALTSIAFGDDNQVIDLKVRKRYADEDQPPGVSVLIHWVGI